MNLPYPFQHSLGANVNKKDNSNWTPLHYAVFNGQVKCAALLIEKGVPHAHMLH